MSDFTTEWIDSEHVLLKQAADEIGFAFSTLGAPVLITKSVWDACVAWADEDSERQTYQEQDARLSDVASTCAATLQLALGQFFAAGQHTYTIYCVPRDGQSTEAATVRLVARPKNIKDTPCLVIDLDCWTAQL